MTNWEALLAYCETDKQRQVCTMRMNGLSARDVALEFGITERNVMGLCQRLKAKAAKQGYAPSHDMTHTVPDGFTVKGVSTYYNDEGQPIGQWVKSSADKEALFEQALEAFKEGLVEDVAGKAIPIEAPKHEKDKDLIACQLLGDHHLGMLAWPPETGAPAWDLNIACATLFNAVDTLAHASSHAGTGCLINLGDFFHANSLKGTTGNDTPLDVDGRAGRIINRAGKLYKRVVTRMLESHDEVWIINVRGNHDPDAALWLNEMLKMYYESEPRVKVFDNYNKFIHFTWGENLVVMHHGDRINTQRVYESVTRNLAKEWGQSKHRFAWLGHIHHKQAQEMGGMLLEHWNVLPSQDAWHAGSGSGSSRSMSSVLLHKTLGEYSRFKVSV